MTKQRFLTALEFNERKVPKTRLKVQLNPLLNSFVKLQMYLLQKYT